MKAKVFPARCVTKRNILVDILMNQGLITKITTLFFSFDNCLKVKLWGSPHLISIIQEGLSNDLKKRYFIFCLYDFMIDYWGSSLENKRSLVTSGLYDVILKNFRKNRFSSLDGLMNIFFEPNLLFRNKHSICFKMMCHVTIFDFCHQKWSFWPLT